ncbi:MAG: type I-U CRISPR-associated protein Cas7 [Planctomycetaceae bacterium]|nr:type I-U CRISPR-associated protein Cas7 [Planctomycetaceae bacterium]
MKPLEFETLRNAVSGTAAAFRLKLQLQPAAGEGTKVFPPTYSGAVYATEQRRIEGHDDPVECVLLDSVQSQANRMEEALQLAIDNGQLKIPLIEVDFTPFFPVPGETDELSEGMRLIDEVGTISALQAPHRIADAILRDSQIDGQRFRDTEVGQQINRVSARNATALFKLCPTALLFGMWDSTGPKGGLGAKFERAIVSEIVGINAVYGVKTSSRIDPLGIQKNAGPLYRRPEGGWTTNPDEALDELKKGKPTGKKILFKQNSKGQDVAHLPGDEKFPDQGRPSEANHSNITPSLSEIDPKTKEYLAGGVTIESAQQTVVISLPALRRLRFPLDGKTGKDAVQANDAARTVLAALGLCAATLAIETGYDLRSRCLLWPDEKPVWQLLDRPGEEPQEFTLDGKSAIELLNKAVAAAKEAGLTWNTEPLSLRPSDDLVQLVVKSQQLAAGSGSNGEDS